jgi:hypothetical protein
MIVGTAEIQLDTSKMFAGLMPDLAVDTSKILAGALAATKFDMSETLAGALAATKFDMSETLAGALAATKFDMSETLAGALAATKFDMSETLAGLLPDLGSLWTRTLADASGVVERLARTELDDDALRGDALKGGQPCYSSHPLRDALVILYLLTLVGTLIAKAGVGTLESIDALDRLNSRYPEINSVFELLTVLAWMIPLCVWLANRSKGNE